MKTTPFHLTGRPASPNGDLEVRDKYRGAVVARVAVPSRGEVDRAIGAAVEAFDEFRHWPAFRRKSVLAHVVDRLMARQEEFAHTLVVETGKTIHEARTEVSRAIDTFTLSMEESTRIGGEYLPLNISARHEGKRAIWKRVPVGPCSFITPFNFPLNLAAHKIGPALASGCAFVLKPDPRTPLTALMLGEILAETDLPAGAFSILPVVEDGIDLFSEDPRLKLLSFTGSPAVGWMLKSRAGKKKVTLELGGNAACIVDVDVDLAHVAKRLIAGAFAQAGQSCIKAQRIIVHRSVFEDLKVRLRDAAALLTMGDPADESTTLGPMISEQEAIRVEQWVNEAREGGARVICGGSRDGSFYEPTLLEGVDCSAKISCREVFGPVATIEPFDEFDDALAVVNDSAFGLQAGVFTRDIDRAFRAFDRLEVGGVIVNDVPATRVDSMPYGGVKDSGFGREGVRFAIEDMTEIRLMVLSGVG